MQKIDDSAFNLELTTIARLLCLKPYARRAVKLDLPLPVYRIEERKTNEALGLVLFQPVAKNLADIQAAPMPRKSVQFISRLATEARRPAFLLYHWTDSTFGLAKAPAFFDIDEWPKPEKRPDITLAPPEAFALLYRYDSDKINHKLNPLELIK